MPLNETKNAPMRSAEAPTSDEKGSGRTSRVPGESTVCDFLYHDVRRIASFLSQFETYGVLQGVKASESVSRNQQLRTNLSAKGSLVISEGAAVLDQTTGDAEQDQAERTYDPLWTNARAFLSYLDSWNLIEENVVAARIGQFVLAAGELSITDLGIAKNILALPAIKKKLREGNKNKSNTEIDAALGIFASLPHAVHATMKTDKELIWSVLKEDCLSISPSDVFLKHGIKLQGSWKMFGILDARTDREPLSVEDSIKFESASGVNVPFSSLVEGLAPMTRHLLGQPADAYGMTPLMIYREVSG